MSYIVKFRNVGRDKLSWSEELKSADDGSIIGAIKRKPHALMSRGIDIDWAEDGLHGTIIVGGLRPVGTLSIDTIGNP